MNRKTVMDYKDGEQELTIIKIWCFISPDTLNTNTSGFHRRNHVCIKYSDTKLELI